MTTARDTDADIDVGEFVEADDKEGFVDLSWYTSEEGGWTARGEGRSTLKRRISGCVSARGLPFTLTRPFPAWSSQCQLARARFATGYRKATLQCATAVAKDIVLVNITERR